MSQFTITYGINSTKIKSAPGQSLNDLLTKACTAFKLDPESHQMKHKTNIVDLSLPIRLANLPQGAKLEIVKKVSNGNSSNPIDMTIKVQISLPIETASSINEQFQSSNLINKFPTTTTIKEILGYFSEKSGIPIMKLSFEGANYEPQLQILTKIIKSDEFHKKLLEFGFNNNLLIRINFKKVLSEAEQEKLNQERIAEQEAINIRQAQQQELRNKLLKEKNEQLASERANQLKDHKQKELEKEKDREDGRVGSIIQGSNVQGRGEDDQIGLSKDETQGKLSDNMDIDEPEGEDKEVKKIENPHTESNDIKTEKKEEVEKEEKRKIEVFRPTKPIETYDYPDHTYEMTVSQAKKYQEMLTAQTKNKKPKVIEEIKSCNIRVRFPDQTHLQIAFKPEETLSNLYSHVDAMLIEKIKYQLVLSHPHKKLKRSTSNFVQAGFSHRTLVIFEVENYLEQKGPFLDVKDIEVKDINDAEDVKLERERQLLKDDDDDDEDREAANTIKKGVFKKIGGSFKSGGSGDGKIPKWLNFGKK